MVATKNELKMENVLSKRMKVSQSDLSRQMEDLKNMCDANFFIVKSLTTVTYAIEKYEKGSILDLEILVELKNSVDNENIPNGFVLKPQILITNALMNHYEGPSVGTNNAFNEINNYLMTNKLMAITPAYSVSKDPFKQSENQINLDIYVGINPNIM